MNKKTDLRIIRSKHSIKKAFIELLTEKGYEGITIQDIADKAMINRNTFYLHYQNKPRFVKCIYGRVNRRTKEYTQAMLKQQNSVKRFYA
ncbi:TetR/AcrR family transcriptional regulator [Paenibacillus sp. FSL R7-0337]|uniref:TetR/AcrR family transcriptional regulator n=1 Tax=Paenibacillus sp. FSL R7-0337 TaxID=1926588 RepID=UPI0021161C47|nr:TetR/AcrR family transcriptional regulator [Paenibacillus sp. FSL R7-0337]